MACIDGGIFHTDTRAKDSSLRLRAKVCQESRKHNCRNPIRLLAIFIVTSPLVETALPPEVCQRMNNPARSLDCVNTEKVCCIFYLFLAGHRLKATRTREDDSNTKELNNHVTGNEFKGMVQREQLAS